MLVTGKFIRLRLLHPSDALMTLNWRLSDRALLLNKGSENVEQQEEWIRTRPSNELNFVIELLSEKPVGMISLININNTNKNAEAARFLIGEEAVSRGTPVAIESMMLLYKIAFENLGLERIYGTVVEDNILMLKWQKFFGMRQEGVMRKHYFINNKFQDAIMVGILKEDI